jgi:penicillin-binding protein 2
MNLDGRKYVILVFVILVGVIYLARLFFMQVVDDTWKLRANEISEKQIRITPPRGVFLDRNGKKIVTNQSYYNLMVKEDDIKDLDTVAFAELLGWTPAQVRARFWKLRKKEGKSWNKDTKEIESNYRTDRSYAFIEELSIEDISHIAPHLDRFPGFYEDMTFMRRYPYASGANIFGYIAEVTEAEVDGHIYKKGDQIGRTGLESYYEPQIRGTKGVKYIMTTASMTTLESYAGGKYDTTAKQSAPLQTGLDIELQVYGEKLMVNKRGCIVAIEPKTGEILALVSAPSFDPNQLVGKQNKDHYYPILVTDEGKPLYPRPLSAEYPPGSIFKLVQALIGLQEGVITPESGFPCVKSMVGCHNHPSAGNLPDGIKHSCNPYFYYVVRRIIQQGKKRSIFADAEVGLNRWSEYMHSFGLGQKLETDIPQIRPGLIPDASYYDEWYGHHTWAFSTIRSISIGQGEVKVTPLQMANIAAIIANKGWYYTPHFVRSIGYGGPLEQYRKKHKTMVDAHNFDPVIEGMRRAVYVGGGTARRAQVPDVNVCAKTGTAQNPQGEDHSILIAFAPMENPKIAIAVFIENAGFGGTWAAPTASLMLEKYLKRKITDKDKEKRILEANLLNVKARPMPRKR